MSKVYIANDPGTLDFSGAKQFGELVFITKGTVDIFNPDRLMRDIHIKLKDWDAEDYLLLSGSIVISFLTALMLQTKNVRLLIFDSKSRKYVCRTLGYFPKQTAEA
jgi:hypothetical protein